MKKKIKIILPIICCFVMIIGSCMSVSAAISGGQTYFSEKYPFKRVQGELIIDYTYHEQATDEYINKSEIINITSESQPVYAFVYWTPIGDKDNFSIMVFSLGNFTYTYNGNTYNSYYNHYVQNPFYYVAEIASINSLGRVDSVSSSQYVAWCSNKSNSNFLSDYVIGDVLDDNYVKLSPPKVKLEYSNSPSPQIEVPKNLSIYRGYSNADKQYKFQLQWDKPIDTDLNVEVMFNIHYKDGPLGLGSHIYVKHPHITYNDGYSAQSNKLQYLEDDLLRSYFQSKEMDLPSVYNITEIYVRFSKEIDGVINYSLWRKIEYLNLDEGNGFDASEDDFDAESSTGAFDTSDNWIDQSVSNGEIVNGSDKENAKAPGIDINGDNVTDVTTPIVNPNIWDSDLESVFGSFKNAIKSSISFVGEFPSMVSEFFGFLPPWVVGCISIGLVMAVLLRLLGR